MSDTTTTTASTTTKVYPKARPKVPAFARYEGTSAFRISRVRARDYARFKKAQKAKATASV